MNSMNIQMRSQKERIRNPRMTPKRMINKNSVQNNLDSRNKKLDQILYEVKKKRRNEVQHKNRITKMMNFLSS